MSIRSRTRRASTLNRLLRLNRRQEGQATLEFILLLPFFILLFLLLVDLGLTMYQYVSVSNAVREGARYGSVNCGAGGCTVDEVIDRTVSRSGGILSDPNEISVSWIDVDGNGANQNRGDAVAVRVDHPYTFLFFPFTWSIRSCSDMRLERHDSGSSLPDGPGC